MFDDIIISKYSKKVEEFFFFFEKEEKEGGVMFLGWRDCFASKLWWVRFPYAPHKFEKASRQIGSLAQLVQ